MGLCSAIYSCSNDMVEKNVSGFKCTTIRIIPSYENISYDSGACFKSYFTQSVQCYTKPQVTFLSGSLTDAGYPLPCTRRNKKKQFITCTCDWLTNFSRASYSWYNLEFWPIHNKLSALFGVVSNSLCFGIFRVNVALSVTFRHPENQGHL